MSASETAVDRLSYEVRLLMEALRNPRACFLSFVSLAVGIAYLFGPIDLIPDSTPYVGHLDEVTFLVGGAVLARWLIPVSVRARIPPAEWPQGAGELRRPLLRTIATFGSGPIFRLSLGRWPSADERALFSAGFIDGSPMVAPILRGLESVPIAKEALGRLALLNLVREGRLPPPEPVSFGARQAHIPSVLGNPLSFRTEKPIAFLHLEKTAGTALVSQEIVQFVLRLCSR